MSILAKKKSLFITFGDAPDVPMWLNYLYTHTECFLVQGATAFKFIILNAPFSNQISLNLW